MKILIIGATLLISLSSFAEDKRIQQFSDGASAQVFEEDGIIVFVTGEAAKYMYLKGLRKNGIYFSRIDDCDCYWSTNVRYGDFYCEQAVSNRFPLLLGKITEYKCRIAISDDEI